MVNSERILSVLKYKNRIIEENSKEIAAALTDIFFESIPLFGYEIFLYKPKTTIVCRGISRDGKEQLMRILTRFEELQLRTITINRSDIRVYAIESVRRNFGFISQEYKLLGTIIFQYLTYSLDNLESIDRERVVTACRAINIYDLILDCLDSYDTLVSRG